MRARCSGNQNPIGKRVNLTQFNVQAEIVGVVGHIKQWGPGANESSAIEAQFFYPFMQLPEKLMPMVANDVAVVLRTAGDPAAVMSEVRRAVEQIDSREVIYGVQTMDEVIAGLFRRAPALDDSSGQSSPRLRWYFPASGFTA